jgi:hypothetical protein
VSGSRQTPEVSCNIFPIAHFDVIAAVDPPHAISEAQQAPPIALDLAFLLKDWTISQKNRRA